jgi:hypothetical protein
MQIINKAIWFAEQRLLLVFQPWNQSVQACLGPQHYHLLMISDLCLALHPRDRMTFSPVKNRGMNLIEHAGILDQVFDCYKIIPDNPLDKLLLSETEYTWFRMHIEYVHK